MNNRNEIKPSTPPEKPSEKKPAAAPAKPPLRRKRAGFASMSNLMNKLVVNLGLDQRLKEHALMNLWPTLVGDEFAHKSRCLFIDVERKLVVSVQDASVGQELSLLRRDLMRKIQAAASGLGVKIDGIRFDMKHFYNRADQELQTAAYVSPLPKPSPADLQSVVLSEDEIDQISRMRQGPDDPSSAKGFQFYSRLNISDRVATIFEHELRLKNWRCAHGYPLCAECREPALQLHGDHKLCAHCFYKSISPKSI